MDAAAGGEVGGSFEGGEGERGGGEGAGLGDCYCEGGHGDGSDGSDGYEWQ